MVSAQKRGQQQAADRKTVDVPPKLDRPITDVEVLTTSRQMMAVQCFLSLSWPIVSIQTKFIPSS